LWLTLSTSQSPLKGSFPSARETGFLDVKQKSGKAHKKSKTCIQLFYFVVELGRGLAHRNRCAGGDNVKLAKSLFFSSHGEQSYYLSILFALTVYTRAR
jgi:hypothetical protein